MARTPLDQRLEALAYHPKRQFLQELNRLFYAALAGPPKRTQNAIALKIPCSSSAITKWLTGEHSIGLAACRALCQAMDLDPQQTAQVLTLGFPELVQVVVQRTIQLT